MVETKDVPLTALEPFDPDASLSDLLYRPPGALMELPRRNSWLTRRAIFVVGSPRSGTTALGSALGGHPLLAAAGESLLAIDMWRILTQLHCGDNWRQFAPLVEYLALDDLLGACGRMLDEVFCSLVRRTAKSRFVDHTPWYGCIIPMLDALFPDCQIIHLVRDGRQVVDSLSRSFEAGFSWAGASTEARVAIWRTSVQRSREGGAKLPSTRYVELKYEDLCANPVGSLRDLCHWLGVEFSQSMLVPLARVHAAASHPDIPIAVLRSDGTAEPRARVTPTGWPHGWSSDDRRHFEQYGGNLLQMLGYAI